MTSAASGNGRSDGAHQGKRVLVFGATGQQGGAVAAALRARGFAVRAFVRNPEGEKARALKASGVELVRGDLSDEASLVRAMESVYGVFSVQPSSGQGPAYGISDEDEVRYGKAVADIAESSDVKYFIYSSTIAAGPHQTGMGHFESKSEIEAHVRSRKLRSTIIRPATFMELFTMPGMGLAQGVFTFFLRPEQRMHVIAAQDIGKITALLFSAPEGYIGRTLEIAGDEVSGLEIGRSLSRAAGKQIKYHRFADSLLNENPFLGGVAANFDSGLLAGNIDIPAVKKEFGALWSLEDWLAGPGRRSLEAALRAADSAFGLR